MSPIVLLALWETLARLGVVDVRFFPAPSSIARTGAHLVANGVLLTDLKFTIVRMFVGLLLGGIPGIIIGAAMGLSRSVRAVVKPIVAALFPIPQIAVLPLILLIFGLGESSKYVSISIGVFFLMTINTFSAVRQIEDIYMDVGRNFGASRWQFFYKIVVPGAMPGILTGLQLALTVALLIAIATEFLAATTGIGYLIWNSWTIFNVDAMYVGLICCALLGIAFQIAVDVIRRLLIPWQRNENR
jgi:NitT/TauT family transport system permease protein